MKLPKLNRHLDGKHPELKEKTSLFPKKRISKAPLWIAQLAHELQQQIAH